MAIQKVFQDSVHFLIIPAALIILKIGFDLVPRPIFFSLVAILIGVYFFNGQRKAMKQASAAKELEESADTFIDELDKEANAKKDKESKKKAQKEQKQKERLRAEEKKKVGELIYLLFYVFISYF